MNIFQTQVVSNIIQNVTLNPYEIIANLLYLIFTLKVDFNEHFAKMCRFVQKCTKMCQFMRRFAEMFWLMPKCADLCRNVPIYPEMC